MQLFKLFVSILTKHNGERILDEVPQIQWNAQTVVILNFPSQYWCQFVDKIIEFLYILCSYQPLQPWPATDICICFSILKDCALWTRLRCSYRKSPREWCWRERLCWCRHSPPVPSDLPTVYCSSHQFIGLLSCFNAIRSYNRLPLIRGI